VADGADRHAMVHGSQEEVVKWALVQPALQRLIIH
jgi:hypothetical protein